MKKAAVTFTATCLFLLLAQIPVVAAGDDGGCDFNDDGYDDIAVGVPAEDIGPHINAGAVVVVYGSPDGPDFDSAEKWTQNTVGIKDQAASYDNFGSQLACGDFDGDGKDDLAISAVNEHVAGYENAGKVHVIYGKKSGLSADGNQVFHQATAGIKDKPFHDERFGYALAIGDFDSDGFDDLAIGAPGEGFHDLDDGLVHILHGSKKGVVVKGNELWHQDRGSMIDSAEEGDAFGSAIAAGDFDGDGFDDLAVGAERESLDTKKKGLTRDTGAVSVIFGSGDGLTSTGNQFWHQDRSGVREAAEDYDFFGASLAVGDFDGNGRDDLAIGAWGDDIASQVDSGVVHVLYGKTSGLSSQADDLWTQNSNGIAEKSESHDRFGLTLAAGNFNAGTKADLAIGAPGESRAGAGFAGVIHVVYGSGTGISSSGDQMWSQDSPGISDAVESSDSFGLALASGDFDGSGREDLLIGVPYEDLGSVENAGLLHLLLGSGVGIKSTGSQIQTYDVVGKPTSDDIFAASMAG